jgi:hypothetical protein
MKAGVPVVPGTEKPVASAAKARDLVWELRGQIVGIDENTRRELHVTLGVR